MCVRFLTVFCLFVRFVLAVSGGAPGRGCQREARTELQAGLLPRAEEGGWVSGCGPKAPVDGLSNISHGGEITMHSSRAVDRLDSNLTV